MTTLGRVHGLALRLGPSRTTFQRRRPSGLVHLGQSNTRFHPSNVGRLCSLNRFPAQTFPLCREAVCLSRTFLAPARKGPLLQAMVSDQSDPSRNRNRNRNRDRNQFLFRIPKPARKRHRASAPLREALRMGMGGQVGKAVAFSDDLQLGPETYTYTAKRYTFTMIRRVRVREYVYEGFSISPILVEIEIGIEIDSCSASPSQLENATAPLREALRMGMGGQDGKAVAFSDDLQLGPGTYTYTAKRYTFTYTRMRRVRVRVRVRVRGVSDQSDPCRNRNRNRDRNQFLFRIPKPARKRHRASAPLREALRMGMGGGQVGKAVTFSDDLQLFPNWDFALKAPIFTHEHDRCTGRQGIVLASLRDVHARSNETPLFFSKPVSPRMLAD